jgi:hypothetical protein
MYGAAIATCYMSFVPLLERTCTGKDRTVSDPWAGVVGNGRYGSCTAAFMDLLARSGRVVAAQVPRTSGRPVDRSRRCESERRDGARTSRVDGRRLVVGDRGACVVVRLKVVSYHDWSTSH